jgi:hypothetical protein
LNFDLQFIQFSISHRLPMSFDIGR